MTSFRNNTALLARDRSERRTGRLIKVMHHIPNDRQSQFMPRSIDIVGYIPYRVVSATSIPTIHVSIRQNLVYHQTFVERWVASAYHHCTSTIEIDCSTNLGIHGGFDSQLVLRSKNSLPLDLESTFKKRTFILGHTRVNKSLRSACAYHTLAHSLVIHDLFAQNTQRSNADKQKQR